MTTALAGAGLVPANRVEEVARAKVVDELLDRVCDRGFLRLGNLRDAVARNQLKLPDLNGPVPLLTGDQLLGPPITISRTRSTGCTGGGSSTWAWIHRFSSVFFGTAWGRASRSTCCCRSAGRSWR